MHSINRFFPLQQTISVLSKPLNNINFFQLRATLKGTIKCSLEIEHCHAPVTLKVRNGIIVKTVQAKGTHFLFISSTKLDIIPSNAYDFQKNVR